MPLPAGTKYRVKTYSSGKRVRLAFWGDRVIETKELPGVGRRKTTKTRKHLNRTRRRIGR